MIDNELGKDTTTTIELRCPAEKIDSFVRDAIGILDRFSDTYTLASSTSRIALSPIVGEMQALKREMNALEPTECGELVKLHLLDGMDTLINGFLVFMQQKESDSQQLLLQGQSILDKGVTELAILRVDPSYGLRPTPTPELIPTALPTPTLPPPPGSDGICHHPADGESIVEQNTCVCGKVTQSIGLWFEMENEKSLHLFVGRNEDLPRVGQTVMACGLVEIDDSFSPSQYLIHIQDRRYLRLWKK